MLEIINNQGKKYTNFNKDISEIKIGVFKASNYDLNSMNI